MQSAGNCAAPVPGCLPSSDSQQGCPNPWPRERERERERACNLSNKCHIGQHDEQSSLSSQVRPCVWCNAAYAGLDIVIPPHITHPSISTNMRDG